MPFVLVRTPVCSIEDYQALAGSPAGPPDSLDRAAQWASPPGRRTMVADRDWVRDALAIASPKLHAALASDVLAPRKGRAARQKLLAYLIRMSTRPTPYGLFSGVALARWGERTDLALGDSPPILRTRPDMEWLYGVVDRLERRREVLAYLRVTANPLAWFAGERVFLCDGGSLAPDTRRISIRASGPVRLALRLSRAPVPYCELVEQIQRAHDAPRERIEQFLDELLAQKFLLTDLRPPCSGDPAAHVVRRLAAIPTARAEERAIGSLLADTAAWDRHAGAASGDALRRLDRRAAALFVAEHAFQVDLALPLAGRSISRRVGEEVVRAAEILLRLTPQPHGPAYLQDYRRKFEQRYGEHREVPLLELLDPDLGLGPPPPAEPPRFEKRQERLLAVALTALRERRRAVELDEASLTELATWTPRAGELPTSLDLFVSVAARSPAALDAGEFQVIVAPSVGVAGAGRTLGRFADLLGPAGLAAIGEVYHAEDAVDPRVRAEVYYQPAKARFANVAVRPALRGHEIRFDGVAPGRAESVAIAPDELLVGVRDGRFYVRWPAIGGDIAGCAGHLLNQLQGPTVARFLCEVSNDGRACMSAFDWGPARSFPFLPRVQSGRLVLRPAEWRVGAILDERWRGSSAEALGVLREHWQLPRHVLDATGDNRLLVDLDDPAQAALLAGSLSEPGRRERLVLQEVLPDLDQIWLPGPSGRYASEFVASLVAKDPVGKARAQAIPAADAGGQQARVRPPGSDWLFAKLYGPACFQNDILTGHLAEFAEDLVNRGLAARWFFIRYADPEPHLRVRFHGTTDGLYPAVCRWAASLVERGLCARLSFDTYDREVERYGGPAGVSLAEDIFAADSRTVVGLLALERARQLPVDLEKLALLTVDDLLAALGLDEPARLTWCRRALPFRDVGRDEYRRCQSQLRPLLDRTMFAVSGGDASPALEVLRERSVALVPTARSLRSMVERGQLGRSRDDVLGCVVHMHLNRLLGPDVRQEQRILALLLRTRESLAAYRG
ncbi:thiopeptide-type bacteriocin biosynthesis protein [Nannocystis punicea]|uniref:Thiopeptide-type bacteriocin biosynthesis protein n=1 Tax=Nannocystis punicea TaxID=2995304 RepID=A0ABY7HBU8_9BACT|nr:thiopeptide-type bacteriocin biosynthesis protein [Nannocystis poenicansa]WAS96587.1 thiopeptide-type bacteriocin biosynthesis protein [Nannocystis poenicansa]